NASPPNARTPPATKKRTPPIIESWECPYVISKKNGNIAPLPTFSVLSKYHVPTGFVFLCSCFSPSSIYALNRILEPGVFCEPA
ncbi:MAG: hypothetical protein MSS95_03555, partial [Bacteroidales bacterium]|nr:hypothetical protein [Bacteroidales bacterium]